MPVLNPNFQDREWDILYKAVADLNGILTNGMQPNAQDRVWDLLYKLTTNIGLVASGGSSGGVVVTAPANINDFSMFPGGVAPSSGVYFAPRDNGSIWEYSAGQTTWKIIYNDEP